MLCEYAKFLGVFLRAPALTSAVVPSSRWLAARMLEGIQLERARVVVELGPGTGAFTSAIQKKLHPDALFLAVEINPLFAEHLARKFPRARIIHGSAEQLDEHLGQRLLSAVHRTLRPGGQLATYAYNHTAWLPGGRRFRRLLKSNFSQVTATPMVWRNLPPAFVYRCQK
jgi:phosphatidylethanolamine/phosphatidyl-N-methylethanolamine N-methyltransferase